MAEWATIASRLGQMAGEYDAALDSKAAREAKTKYNKWKDIETLRARWGPAIMQEQGRNRRHSRDFNLKRWEAQNPAPKPFTYSDEANVNKFVENFIDSSPTFGSPDLYDDKGYLNPIAQVPRSQLIQMFKSSLMSRPELQQNPQAAAIHLQQMYEDLKPTFTFNPGEKNMIFDDVPASGKMSFGGRMGEYIVKIRKSIQRISSSSAREKELANLMRQLKSKYSPLVAAKIYREIITGL